MTELCPIRILRKEQPGVPSNQVADACSTCPICEGTEHSPPEADSLAASVDVSLRRRRRSCVSARGARGVLSVSHLPEPRRGRRPENPEHGLEMVSPRSGLRPGWVGSNRPEPAGSGARLASSPTPTLPTLLFRLRGRPRRRVPAPSPWARWGTEEGADDHHRGRPGAGRGGEDLIWT